MRQSDLLRQFDAHAASLIARAKPMLEVSHVDLNRKTDAHDWTLGQLFDHLVKSDGSWPRKFLPELRSAPAANDPEVRYGLFGRLIMNGMTRPNIPVPKVMMPTGGEYDHSVIQQYIDALEALRQGLAEAGQRDLRAIRVQSEAFKLIKFNGMDVLGVCIAHGKRHLAQAEAIRAALNGA